MRKELLLKAPGRQKSGAFNNNHAPFATKFIHISLRVTTAKARAFTLFELLLVMVVLMLLVGLIWPNLGARQSGGKLEVAAHNLAALMQIARGEAMINGKQFRCNFDLQTMRAVIEEEIDPLKEPGVFEPVKAHWAVVDLGEENIRCLVVQFDPWETQLREQEAKILEKSRDNETAKSLLIPPIVFYPDGTADPATVLLGAEEGRNVTLSLNGLTGQIKIDLSGKIAEEEKSYEYKVQEKDADE